MEELAVKLAQVDQRSRSNSHRLDKLEQRQDDLDSLVGSLAALANEQEHIKTDVSEIKRDVKLLTEKPGRRWDGVVDKVLWAAAGSVAALVLSTLTGGAL